MGSFVLDFSAYNALASTSGHGGHFYGADDSFLGGEAGFVNRRSAHLHHHQHHQPGVNQTQQQHQQQQHQQQQHAHRIQMLDRNSLVRLEAEKTLQERRRQHIANFGATWLKPPGMAKTLYQIREECREQEEQAEAERREELARQLAQAEAEAAMEAAGGPGGDGVDNDDDDMMGGDGAGDDVDSVDGGGSGRGERDLDLDDAIPDADGEEFSFGDNDDEDDPFASTSEEDEEDSDEESEEEEDNNDEEKEEEQEASRNYGSYHRAAAQQNNSPPRRISGSAPMPTFPPITRQAEEDQERREMRHMRATEDRFLGRPRLSAGLMMRTGLYEEDVDEEEQAQMLQEDDLVREGRPGEAPGIRHTMSAGAAAAAAAAARHRQQQQQQQHQQQHRRWTGSSEDMHQQSEMNMDMDMDMDMDLDMDAAIPEGSSVAMDLSALGSTMGADESGLVGIYEHTDSEAELSSSIGEAVGMSSSVGLGGGSGLGGRPSSSSGRDDLPHHSFLAGSSGPTLSQHLMVATPAGRRSDASRMRRSVRSNDLDISSLLSHDGSSSNMGSSPQVRR